LGAVGLVMTPLFVGYLIVVPLLFVRLVVQLPVEYWIVRQASKRVRKHPAIKIAVAGSFGKTSMREVLKTVISQQRRVAAPPHSYNTPIGISRFLKSLDGTEEVLVFELGEYYPGDIKRLSRMTCPDLGVITGINEAHLHKFKRIERTVTTIFELAGWLGHRPLYMNGESPLVAQNARPGDVAYTRTGAGDWTIERPVTGLDGTRFTLIHGRKRYKVHSHLLGLHQLGPLAAAADIAANLGLTDEEVVKGLESVMPFEHRLEPHVDPTGVTLLDDSYNGNPSGAKAIIDFLGGLSGHRRFYVTPGLVEMGPKTAAVHEEIGRLLAKAGVEEVVLIRNSATPHILEGLTQAGYTGHVTWFDDGPAAFAALPEMTVSGDVVVLQNDWPDQYS
jgi:UDP-N-acetylmuramoyl-tripeptide--D-alanyl-D-alanine ligase